MDILLIIFLILGLFTFAILFPINYKGGEMLNNTFILTFILALIVILGFLGFTALPSNYLLQKVLIAISTALGAIGYILKLTSKGTLPTIRILLTISLLSNFALMIFKI